MTGNVAAGGVKEGSCFSHPKKTMEADMDVPVSWNEASWTSKEGRKEGRKESWWRLVLASCRSTGGKKVRQDRW